MPGSKSIPHQLEDLEIIGDEFVGIGVPWDSQPGLKKCMMAALKAHILGYRSIDYVLKEFGSSWDVEENLSKVKWRLLYEVPKAIKHHAGEAVALLADMTGRPPRLGLIVSGAALIRGRGPVVVEKRNGAFFQSVGIG